jgi:hypothetical protein
MQQQRTKELPFVARGLDGNLPGLGFDRGRIGRVSVSFPELHFVAPALFGRRRRFAGHRGLARRKLRHLNANTSQAAKGAVNHIAQRNPQ